MTVREEAQVQAEEAYTKFLRLCKVGGIWIVVILIALAIFDFGHSISKHDFCRNLDHVPYLA